MGRSTKGYIPRNNVTIEDIIDILRSDGANLTPDNLDVREIFDQLQGGRKGNLYGKFVNGDGKPNTAPATRDIATDYTSIDPQVPGETDEDKLSNVKDTGSYDLGDLRGYGGNEVGDIEDIPKIYWSHILDKEDTEYAGDSQEYFPQIVMYPEEEAVKSSTSTIIQNTKNLYGEDQSAMFSGNTLIDTYLATNIGIDYPEGYEGGPPKFEIKVTPRIADLTQQVLYQKRTYNSEGSPVVVPVIPLPAILKVLGFSAVATSLYTVYAELVVGGELAVPIKEAAQILWDYLIGPHAAKLWKFTVDKILNFKICIEKLLESLIGTGAYDSLAIFVNTIALPILYGLAVFFGSMIVSDIIWDLFNKPVDIVEAPYRFKNHAFDVYNFTDIADSSYTIAFGNKIYGKDDIAEFLIENGGKVHGDYSVEDYNYDGTPFSASNLINQFPTDTSVRDKYLNWNFYPKGVQYDLDTAPPIIEYFVEVIPVQNCVLHETKTTAFSVLVMPDKYLAPKFSISTPTTYNGYPALHLNTSMTCKNARYCDFVLMRKIESTSTLWGVYPQSWINAPSFANSRRSNDSWTSCVIPYTGKNLSATGFEYGNYADRNDPLKTLNEGIYEVHFMQEKNTNVVRNPYFRAEYSLANDDMVQYWQSSSNMSIDKGSAYKSNDGNEGWIKQYLNSFGFSQNYKRFHLLKLEVTLYSGKLYLKYNGLFQNWVDENDIDGANWMWNWRIPAILSDGPGSTYKYASAYLNKFFNSYVSGYDIPEKITETSEGIYFNESGTYFVILEARGEGPDKNLEFIFSNDSEGYISMCKLHNIGYGTRTYQRVDYVESINNLYGRDVPVIYYTSGAVTSKKVTLGFQTRTTYTTNLAFEASANSYGGSTIKFGESPSYDNFYDNTFLSSVTDVTVNETYTPSDEYITFMRGSVEVYVNAQNHISGINHGKLLNTFTCNSPQLRTISVEMDIFYDTDIDFSNSNIWFRFKDIIPYRVYSLNISNTNMDDSIDNLDSISYAFIANNTDVHGFLESIISVPRIELDNTEVYQYNVGSPSYPPGTEPYVVWKNSKTPIEVESLNRLIFDMDYSGTYNGYLDIGGDNPEITNVYALEAIDSLVSKGWNVLYNAKSIPVITLVGDNPLTWTIGETFVDPGATAYDDRDGDITSSIVAVSTVDINTEGTYNVTYNVTDSDGNNAEEVVREVVVEESSYSEVTIGTQTWMAVNLDIDDGQGGIYAYNNDESNVDTYGRLYTWDAAMRVAYGIEGWHLPTDAEWTTLTTYLGGTSVAGGKLKEAGTEHWNSPNTGATNESGFTALPGGTRYDNGTFYGIGYFGYWWSATDYNAANAWSRNMSFNDSRVYRSGYGKVDGYSVRLIKDYSHTPTITLLGDSSVTINVGDTYTDAGATAYDTRYGDITDDIVVVSNVNTSVAGTYIVTYNITTEDGNSAEEVVRTVVVEEIKTIWGTEIVEVTNPITGRTWMDRNIGATRAATSSTDSEAYGHLFQWGRNPDGHELRTSLTTSTLSSTDVPGHGDFIITSSSPYDWRSPQNDNLWQGIIADGWRLPTEAEWNEERLTWSSNNSTGAYNSVLKLPVAGYRYYSNGSLYSVGSYGYYWSSTLDGANSRLLYFYSSNAYMGSNYRAYGGSVRLIKDNS